MGSDTVSKHTVKRPAKRQAGQGDGQASQSRMDTREEFTWGYFRPAGLIEARRGQKDGTLTAWEFHNYNSRVGYQHSVRSRTGKWSSIRRTRHSSRLYRGLAATANHFVRESVGDELAHAVRWIAAT